MSTMIDRTLAGSTYGYSATRIEALGASEYTLVAIAADDSGSVTPFRAEIERCIAEIVRACGTAPRADHLMLRTLAFHGKIREVHGFRPLLACPLSDYDGCLKRGGATALYDACHNAVASVTAYGRTLTQGGLAANAVVFVITDGWDNRSSLDAAAVKAAIEDAVTGEALEAVHTVLVGVNVAEHAVGQRLAEFSAQVGFDQYLELKAADRDTLARLAAFATRSIAVASQALGTGAPVKSLTF